MRCQGKFPQLGRMFDRIIMPLPRSAGDFIDLALGACAGWMAAFLRSAGEGRFCRGGERSGRPAGEMAGSLRCRPSPGCRALFAAAVPGLRRCADRLIHPGDPHLVEGQQDLEDDQDDNIPLHRRDRLLGGGRKGFPPCGRPVRAYALSPGAAPAVRNSTKPAIRN